MSFKAKMKKPGDMIRSEDWNEAMQEIFRLENNKLSLEGGGITGPLSISSTKGPKNGSPLRLEREEDKAFISMGDMKALSISENGNLGIGTPNPDTELHVVGKLLGAAKDMKGNSMRICCGKTIPGNTNWINHNPTALILDVDISSCGFTSTPFCIVNLHGSSNQFGTTGGSSAYDISPKGFRMWIRNDNSTAISSSNANTWNWHIHWVALGN